VDRSEQGPRLIPPEIRETIGREILITYRLLDARRIALRQASQDAQASHDSWSVAWPRFRCPRYSWEGLHVELAGLTRGPSNQAVPRIRHVADELGSGAGPPRHSASHRVEPDLGRGELGGRGCQRAVHRWPASGDQGKEERTTEA
jgi:hypothetical protein